MSEYVEFMTKLENDILTDEEKPMKIYKEIKSDNTNLISVEDPNRSNSHECKRNTYNCFNFIGD